MSGGAFDYIEFLPENILREIEKLEGFAANEDVRNICSTNPEAWHKLGKLMLEIAKAKQAIQEIDTNFLHDVEWIASGDTTKFRYGG